MQLVAVGIERYRYCIFGRQGMANYTGFDMRGYDGSLRYSCLSVSLVLPSQGLEYTKRGGQCSQLSFAVIDFQGKNGVAAVMVSGLPLTHGTYR